MSLEKNRNTLKDALGRMKSYDAPDFIWGDMSESLDNPQERDESVLNEAVGKLSDYSPPATVWNNLTKSLDNQKTGKIVKMQQGRKWLGIAAAAAVLMVASVWAFSDTSAKVTKMYAQETMQQFQIEIDWNADEGSFERITEQLAQVNDPRLNRLKLELDELTSARGDVEDMLKSYGNDPQLVTQLGDIERERSDIYREIIELI